MKLTTNWQTTKKKILDNKTVKDEYDKLALQYEVADQIIEIRKKLKITQSELAVKTKTTQSAIARFETARQAPTFNLLSRIATALNYKLEIKFLPK
jgi:ribosome-binding protein aMBF1 (putative translation factor)